MRYSLLILFLSLLASCGYNATKKTASVSGTTKVKNVLTLTDSQVALRDTVTKIVVYDTTINSKRVAISFRPNTDTPGMDRFTLYIRYGNYRDSTRAFYDRWEDTTIADYRPLYLFNNDGSITNSKICMMDRSTLLVSLPRNNAGSQLYIVRVSDNATKIITKENDLFSEGGFFIFMHDRRIGIPELHYLDNGKLFFYNFGTENTKPISKKMFLNFNDYAGYSPAELLQLKADYHKLFR